MALPMSQRQPPTSCSSRSLDHDEVLELLGRYRGVTMYHADHAEAPGEPSGARPPPGSENLDTVFYGGSPMYLADSTRPSTGWGLAWRRCGRRRNAEHRHRARQHHHADTTHPRYLERLSSAGIARTGIELRIGDENDERGRRRRAGRKCWCAATPSWRAIGTRRKRRRNAAQWLAAYRRSRVDGQGRLPDDQGSRQGHDHQRWLQHLSARDREVLQQHPRCSRCPCSGPPRPGRGGRRLHRRPSRMTVTDAEPDALCLDNIARFKRPRAYHRSAGAAGELAVRSFAGCKHLSARRATAPCKRRALALSRDARQSGPFEVRDALRDRPGLALPARRRHSAATSRTVESCRPARGGAVVGVAPAVMKPQRLGRRVAGVARAAPDRRCARRCDFSLRSA